MNNFADRLKKLRAEREMTQQELADRLGISKAAISRYESGDREPSFEVIETLTSAFSVDLPFLLGFSDRVERLSGDDTDDFDENTGTFVQITDEERTLIRKYRHADDKTRELIKFALKDIQG